MNLYNSTQRSFAKMVIQSFVYEANNMVIGMFFGINERLDVWLFTLLKDVLGDNKIITGASEVRLPVHSS